MYLIDGNNLIGHTSPHELRDPLSKRILISKLQIFRQINRAKITVVFDGSPDPEMHRAGFDEKSFSVVFPPFGQKADIVITEIIASQDDVRRFFVVSSDREIKDSARKKGAKVITCEDFDRRLKKALKKYKKMCEMKKENVSLSPLEVNHWSDIFGKKDD
jgi:predicted RNA-binding protein with PIN domain